MLNLDSDLSFISGLGENRLRHFSRLDIENVRDLINYFPRDYQDRTKFSTIESLNDGDTLSINAFVSTRPILSRVRRGMELVKFRVSDDTGSLDITFFNQPYVEKQIKEGHDYIFYGKIKVQGSKKSMMNPIFEELEEDNQDGKIVPIYSLTRGLSQNIIGKSAKICLDKCHSLLPNIIPQSLEKKYGLCEKAFSYFNIHFPKDFESLEKARRRLIFQEFFVLCCAFGDMKTARSKHQGIFIESQNFNNFYKTLPFSPTNAQKRAVAEIARDFSSTKEMNRLIQGDVGSGKTLIAAAAIWACAKSKLQSAFMAPTEILVNQHFETFKKFLEPFGLTILKLTGSMTAKEKKAVYDSLKSGECDLVVGTHALISEKVEFSSLAFVITDEQHRFGVQQRSALISKGKNPHTLVMSATPIPRTLALLIYGDLDVSIVDELPKGRQKIDTFCVDESYRTRINTFMEKEVLKGRQVFVVCPAIEENEESELKVKTAVEYSEELQKYVFPNLKIACIHGKMKTKEKDAIMGEFVKGNLDIMVSTTVIEVGVDVPNASLMIIENAERFGLSQLHQLRGRVGRGKNKSYCVLMTNSHNDDTKVRMEAMVQNSDGFKISEIDLKLRGPGDFFGRRQHGLPQMNIADLCTDMSILKSAQEAAKDLLKISPNLEGEKYKDLRDEIQRLFKKNENILN